MTSIRYTNLSANYHKHDNINRSARPKRKEKERERMCGDNTPGFDSNIIKHIVDHYSVLTSSG